MPQWRLLLVWLVAAAAVLQRAACDQSSIDQVLDDCADESSPADKAQLEQNRPKVKAEMLEIEKSMKVINSLSALPEGTRVMLAKKQTSQIHDKTAVFQSLPVSVQECIMAHYLATNQQAMNAFQKNEAVIEVVGFEFSAENVMTKAKALKLAQSN